MATAAHTEVPSGGHKGPFPPFQRETFASQLVWFAICFVVLYLVVSKLALPRVGGILAERRGRVQSRAHLLETVWEAAPDIQTRTVDMHVQRLRTKLGEAGDLIETVRGFGYRLKSGHSRSA